MVYQEWQENAFREFHAMHEAGVLKNGEQILFGIEGLSDKTAYAVLNAENNCQTLTLCMDRTALIDYAMVNIDRQKNADHLRLAGRMLEMNCLQCRAGSFSEEPLRGYMMRFDHMKEDVSQNTSVSGVVPRRWRAGFLPDSDLSAQEMHRLLIALKTAMAYFEDGHTLPEAIRELKQHGKIFTAQWKLGADPEGMDDELMQWSSIVLSDHAQIEYPSPVLEDELQARRVRKLPSSGATLGCSLRRLPIPVSENPVRTPVMLAMIDDVNGVVGTDVVEDYEKNYFDLASSFMNYMEEFGRPKRVLVTDERTYGLVCAMSQQIGVPVEKVEELPDIDGLIHAYLDMILGSMQPEQPQEKKPATKAAPKGRGICMICGSELSAKEMKAHIVGCVDASQEPDCEENLLLHISDPDDEDYWMDVALKRDATLAQLDNFLREVWVDCCGHMSMFVYGGVEYYSSYAAEMGGRSMNARIFKEMPCGAELLYDYDFGTTTRLRIEVIGEVKAAKRHRKAVQLARNIQPKYACVACGREAEYVESRMGESIAEMAYCESCAVEKAQRDEVQMLPLLNSPRCGMCGYGAWMLGNDLFPDEE